MRQSHAAGSYQRQLAVAGIPLVHAAVEGPPNVTNTMPASLMPKGTPTSSHLTLAQWGQKKITWRKKQTGKTYFQTLSEDMGYLDWSRVRYMSLPQAQQDFVDYCCAQLENDAMLARQPHRNNQY